MKKFAVRYDLNGKIVTELHDEISIRIFLNEMAGEFTVHPITNDKTSKEVNE